MLVNTLNTVGVMGKGIAKEFRSSYPEMFSLYQQKCEDSQFDIGQLMLYRTASKTILNFPTKRHWRNSSRVEYIETGLKTFALNYGEHRRGGFTPIAKHISDRPQYR